MIHLSLQEKEKEKGRKKKYLNTISLGRKEWYLGGEGNNNKNNKKKKLRL